MDTKKELKKIWRQGKMDLLKVYPEIIRESSTKKLLQELSYYKKIKTNPNNLDLESVQSQDEAKRVEYLLSKAIEYNIYE